MRLEKKSFLQNDKGGFNETKTFQGCHTLQGWG